MPVRTLLLFLPLVVIWLALMAVALYDLAKRELVKGGNKLPWALVIIIFEFIGPLIYFIFGREEE